MSKRPLVRYYVSLPSRERGLKFEKRLQKYKGEESLPSRERGLKFEKRLQKYKGEERRSPRGSVD